MSNISISERKTGSMHGNSKIICNFDGFVDENIRFIEDFQLLDEKTWRRFVQQFREDADFDGGWRGEYWGKMMRGASLTYEYTKNRKLYDILSKTVSDMIESADETGRISSYAVSHEFEAWDLWARKYVLLGMQYFLEICKEDELKNRIIESMKSQVDYIMSKIGNGEGKKSITLSTRHWRGLNSSSILEPIVRLYNITKEKKYLDFAEYIVSFGGTDVANLFDLAYENKFFPYQYPITKAYEMTSCFEGLLEYYYVTGIEKYKIALINFADRVLESDFTIIGSSGCTHELFDHSSVRQANTTNGKTMQETCVTVTLMKFFYRMALLTGDTKYIDAFEISMYNAYFGSINSEKIVERKVVEEAFKEENIDGCNPMALPFDSYSPLTSGTRANGIGGIMIMSDRHYYGCCVCIGSAGNGLIPKMAMFSREDGYALNLFVDGIIKTDNAEFVVKTEYPKYGVVDITVNSDSEFTLYIRNPEWSKETKVSLNQEETEVCEGYIKIKRKWSYGDRINIELDMRTRVKYPVKYGYDILMNKVIWGHNYMVQTYDEQDPVALRHIALLRGPVTLAQENRLGYSVDDPIEVKIGSDDYVEAIIPETDTAPYKHIVEVKVELEDGNYITLTDYASAGKLWNNESKMAAWMLTKYAKTNKNGER